MSSSDRLLLILHIGFAIFTLGPVTAVTMASPRYIRMGEAGIVRFLNRTTRIYSLLALGVFLFGLFLAKGKFDKPWLSASMTLFVVAAVLLFIIERDQRKAVHKIEVAVAERTPVPPTPAPEPAAKAADEPAQETAEETSGEAEKPAETEAPRPVEPAPLGEPARVETGRIATISGVVALIWIVILILMVWH